MGNKQYPDATKLLIIPDRGGSDSYRNKLWKTELQRMAPKLKMEITVCHFPPDMNWKGIPLEDYETTVGLVGAVKTKAGLKVKARLDLK